MNNFAGNKKRYTQMMWISRREWLLAGASLILLISGGAYYFFSPVYKEHFIHHIGASKNIWQEPEKSGNSALIIKVEGYANDDYKLMLDFYEKDKQPAARFMKTYSEVIQFPAGDISGTLKRDFFGEPNESKIHITYLPQHQSSAKGTIKLKVGIF